MMSEARKRIAVTGGHGKIGKTLEPYIREHGYEVFVIDRDGPLDPEEAMMKADLEDFGETLDALSSTGKGTYARAELGPFDAVVHLASIPHPRMIRDAAEFHTNMMATYNVFEAARRLGIKNVV
ncbi:NAD-dependent epimerase/dehydratase family protein [Paraburkholderia phenoliruptrix]|uniref:NAD-dependent epimerase/dehydratase family protein n=1 Tax=Paraburkholderia phenoliruptrix TaxID=252970 RepID=UPI002869B866|nr:NAD-dependent epimerase/dehydratase family protein [Paraburkholderia phenoliruptrix]WMY09572.1 NAD-dependent epimerase/dehydratase family protein [Paraburkholderia phenoliruptrix]